MLTMRRWPVDPNAPRLVKDRARPICITSSKEADLETAVRLQQHTASMLRSALDCEVRITEVLRSQLTRISSRSNN